jgi:hypothetical protein
MSRKHFIICSLAISVVLIFFSTISNSVSLQAQNETPDQEKSAEQTHKNIQILKGLPSSQLTLVMNMMRASLGVNCGYCHVNDSTGWHFESDEKHSKGTTRKMMQMVMDLNAKNFGGEPAITCYTCHHGQHNPQSVISFPQTAPEPKRDARKGRPMLPTVDEVLLRYENAIGGIDANKKITSRVAKGVLVTMRGDELPMEVTKLSPSKYLTTVTNKERGTMSWCYDGVKGWMSDKDGVEEAEAGDLARLKRDAPMFPIMRLRELSAQLHMKWKDTVNGATAFILAAEVGEKSNEQYYIDSASGLLVRRIVLTETMLGLIPEQVDYSDYRTVDGVKIPFLIRMSSVDPRESTTRRITSVEHNVSVDEKKFIMPEIKK